MLCDGDVALVPDGYDDDVDDDDVDDDDDDDDVAAKSAATAKRVATLLKSCRDRGVTNERSSAKPDDASPCVYRRAVEAPCPKYWGGISW